MIQYKLYKRINHQNNMAPFQCVQLKVRSAACCYTYNASSWTYIIENLSGGGTLYWSSDIDLFVQFSNVSIDPHIMCPTGLEGLASYGFQANPVDKKIDFQIHFCYITFHTNDCCVLLIHEVIKKKRIQIYKIISKITHSKSKIKPNFKIDYYALLPGRRYS